MVLCPTRTQFTPRISIRMIVRSTNIRIIIDQVFHINNRLMATFTKKTGLVRVIARIELPTTHLTIIYRMNVRVV